MMMMMMMMSREDSSIKNEFVWCQSEDYSCIWPDAKRGEHQANSSFFTVNNI